METIENAGKSENSEKKDETLEEMQKRFKNIIVTKHY